MQIASKDINLVCLDMISNLVEKLGDPSPVASGQSSTTSDFAFTLELACQLCHQTQPAKIDEATVKTLYSLSQAAAADIKIIIEGVLIETGKDASDPFNQFMKSAPFKADD